MKQKSESQQRFFEHGMQQALEVATNCREIEWYGVGCVICNPNGAVLATGYTGELKDEFGKDRHAEDVALYKAQLAALSCREAILFSTLEPCSVRAPGETPCVPKIIKAGLKKVVFGAKEPYDPALKIVCQGAAQLRAAGVTVIQLTAWKEECLKSIVSKRRKPTEK